LIRLNQQAPFESFRLGNLVQWAVANNGRFAGDVRYCPTSDNGRFAGECPITPDFGQRPVCRACPITAMLHTPGSAVNRVRSLIKLPAAAARLARSFLGSLARGIHPDIGLNGRLPPVPGEARRPVTNASIGERHVHSCSRANIGYLAPTRLQPKSAAAAE
jgi:hypothetical protein